MDKIANPKSGEQLLLPPIKKKKPYFYIVIVSAFLGALLLWFYAIGYDSAIFERDISGVPVTITGIDKLKENKQFMVYEDLNIDITVTISGKRSDINKIKAENLIATVDVSKVEQAGENPLPIIVATPNGISVKSQSSTIVSLYLDEFIIKTLPVSVTYSDYVLPEGFKLGNTEVNPVVITVDGPKNELDKINSAYIELTLGEVNDSITAYGPIFLKYDTGEVVNNKYVTLNKNEAYVNVQVYKEKKVPVKVSLTGGVFSVENAVVSLSQDYITISGSINMIDSINQVTINVDETAYDLKKTITVTEYFSLLLPEGIDIVSGEVQVTAEIKIPDITKKSFTIAAENIAVTQIEGKTVSVKSGVTVTVIGYRDVLSTMTADKISASIDAAGVFNDTDGNEIAYVDFTFADGIYSVYTYETYTVKTNTQ